MRDRIQKVWAISYVVNEEDIEEDVDVERRFDHQMIWVIEIELFYISQLLSYSSWGQKGEGTLVSEQLSVSWLKETMTQTKKVSNK